MQSKQAIIASAVRGGRTLDIGYAQEPNLDLPGEVYGIDIVQNRLALSNNYKETRVVDLNIDPIPYPDGFFGTVTMGCTLAHVANPIRLLCEINRVLAPGGALVVTSPNPHYYWEAAINVFYHYFKNRVAKSKCEEHFFSFSRFEMRVIQERAGFEVVRELGYLFALVKTPLRFNPLRHPGIAYEIVYISKKVGEPKSYTITEPSNRGGGIERVPTKF